MTRNILLAIGAAAMAVPAAAQTGGIILGAPQFSTYANRGQCTAALAKERNLQRKDATRRGAGYENLSGSEFNKASLTTTRCERRNGRYVVVYYANGF